jgi:3-phosphoshikimate 1-carboxyvinyltransferase
MCFSLAAFNPAGLPVRIEDPSAWPRPSRTTSRPCFAEPAAPVPVICIDGPTASGKGTLAAAWPSAGLPLLDSGALYRITGLAARARPGARRRRRGGAAELARTCPCASTASALAGRRGRQRGHPHREAGMDASRVSALPGRTALLALQQAAARLPGLVADGRDMGTVIFPQAPLKVF